MAFDPDKYLAKTTPKESTEFDPDQYLAKPTTSEISQTESALRGAAQEATFGLAEELTGAAETGLEALKGSVPLTQKDLLETYKRLRDESRAAYKAAEEANPASYLGGQIVGGIAPALATGGAAVAGKLAAGAATKAGIGQLMKEGAKSGLKYGAAQGVGKSEAEITEGEVGQLAKDIAAESVVGGLAGGVMPLAAPAIKGVAKVAGKAPQAVGSLIKKLPGYDKAAASYEWGTLGKGLTIEDIDPEMSKLGKTILKDVSDAKGSVNIKKAKEVFEQAGIVVDTEQALQQVISDVENIAKSDFLKASKANEIIPLLKQLAGKDAKAQKLVDQLEKKIVKESIKSSTKAEQAIIKGEKKLFDQALKSGEDIESITNLKRSFEDIAEIPTDTSQGTIGGIKAQLKRTGIDLETGEDVVEDVTRLITSDITPYQPTKPTLTIDPTTGRAIAVSKDLGTGKVDALVGEILDNPAFTPDQVPLNEIDNLISTINNFTGIAKTQGGSADPAVRRLQGFAGELRKLQNEAMEQSGLGTGVIEGRKKLSSILEAEKLLDIDQPYSAIKSIDEAQKATQLAEQFGYEKGFKGREERRLVEDLLQGEIQPQTLKEADLLRQVNAIVGRTGDRVSGDTISKSSLFQQIVTELPNMAGQGKAAIDQSMRKIGSAISNATPVEIQDMATLLKNSSNKSAQTFAPMVQQAIGADGKVRKSALFALYQQPAFREVVKQISGIEGATPKQLNSEINENEDVNQSGQLSEPNILQQASELIIPSAGASELTSMPRGIRNNNPGNIDYNKNVKWEGVTGKEKGGRFAKFESPEMGIRAMAKLLTTYNQRYGLSTLPEIIERYAPPVENDTQSYIKQVSKLADIPVNQNIDFNNKQTMLKLLKAMIKIENGIQPYTDEQILKGISLR